MINRNFIDPKEGRLTVLQFIGFCLLILGVIGLITASILSATAVIDARAASSVISIAFFIAMLGFAFAFPSLLEGSEGLSTMRIIVFMVTNVICMLLLKIGWAADSLGAIQLDQYWMGVIAFVFGAKATQAFFESGMARLGTRKKVTDEEVAKLCAVQNEADLKRRFNNILAVSDSVRRVGEVEEPVVVIYLTDDNIKDLPRQLPVKLPDGTSRVLPTEIVGDNDEGGVHFNQKSMLDSNGNKGSICCTVSKKVKKKKVQMAVTAGHVYTGGAHISLDGELVPEQQNTLAVDENGEGKWFLQLIDHKNDIGVFSIEKGMPDAEIVSFKGKGHYEVTTSDVSKTKVTLISSASAQKVRGGYILDFNVGWDIPYQDGKFAMNNIILIGDSPDRTKSKSLSVEGDSGGAVYEPESGQLVGLILGGNKRFTWVLPINEILHQFNFILD